jgi:hypothetical protein
MLVAALALPLACCVAPSTPPPPARVPAPPIVVTRVPAPVTDWRDAFATPGDWTWSEEAGRSTARFAGNALVLRCEPSGRVTVTRSGSAGPSPTLTITTTATARSFAATPRSDQAPALTITLANADPLLDAMAFSRGRFMVTAPGLAPLYVPSWPEIGRVIEDCR